ncbi:MAG: DUF1214 domain-containing protein [bacterium]
MSAWGAAYTPPASVAVDETVDAESAPVEQVAAMDAALFFTRLAELMGTNPPAKADAPMLGELAQIGVVPGRPFAPDMDLLPEIDAGVKEAQAGLVRGATAKATGAGGWTVNRGLGNFGTEYAKRAHVAVLGLGANLDADAIYATARTDAAGEALNGAQRYVMHFAKGQLPPANAFWSLTMYNDRQFFVANPLGRYAIGDRDKLTVNPDGSLDLYIQTMSPGAAKQSNWLPAPRGWFNLMMRVYWPKAAMLDGTYQIPPIVEVAPASGP